ncbi:unnamed protein product [Merluccius merluccius]
MARSKARIWTCCLLFFMFLVAIIVCVVMLVKTPCSKESYTKGAVAADSETCSNIGRDTLRSGGSAVDGAIAALLCTSVINPQSMGLGGGTIFTVMDSSGKVKIINARETVPKMFNRNLMKDCSKTPLWSPVSQWIGVPGELRGYELAHRLYGKLPWASLFQPTIQLARGGFPIPPIQARFIPHLTGNISWSLRKLYLDKNGNLLKAGDIMKFEKLADTLEMVANHGADALYTGKIAEELIRDLQNEGAKLTMEDLVSYKARVSDALNLSLGEYQIHLAPPPSGGVLLGLILNIMKGYALNPESLMGEQKALTYHRFVEACKFANGLKKYLRDPQFNSGSMAEKITEESFADHLRSLISSERSHDAQYYNMTPYVDSMGTTHVSVLDEDGTAVAVTSSINHIFGSKVYSPSTGVILNNQLTDFCGRADNIVAGEQPPSSMSPTILQSKTKTLVTGASGGSMIITGTALTIMNNLWFGKSLKEAIDTPVVFVDSKNELKFEPNFDQSVIEALKSMGHTQKNATYFYNVVNSVTQDNGCICAVSDLRKQGKAAGY